MSVRILKGLQQVEDAIKHSSKPTLIQFWYDVSQFDPVYHIFHEQAWRHPKVDFCETYWNPEHPPHVIGTHQIPVTILYRHGKELASSQTATGAIQDIILKARVESDK
ncbi:hypothetical protein AWENTII_007244 [Aspergillus wentii]